MELLIKLKPENWLAIQELQTFLFLFKGAL